MKNVLLILILLPLSLLSQTNFEKAEKFFEQRNFAQAQPLFESELKAHPNHLQTIEYLGDIQCVFENWEAAANYYKKLKTADPKKADYQYKYGGALAMFAKESSKLKAVPMLDDIEAAFLKAIQNDPKHIEARWALVELYLQLPGILGGSESKALRYANELQKISVADGYLCKAHISEYFKRYTSAEKQYRNAIQLGHSKKAYQKLADLYKNKLNQPERAKQLLVEFGEKHKS